MSNHAQSRVPRRLGTVSIAAAALTIAACGSSSDSSVADTSTPVAAAASTVADSTTAASTAAESTGPDSADSGGGSFTVAISEPAAIDPGLSGEVEGYQVVRLLFESLVGLDADLELEPGVADSWEVGEDGVTWTFQLRDTAAFSNGRPVVADDFVYAFARAADPDLAAPASYQGSPILGWDDVAAGEVSGEIGYVAAARASGAGRLYVLVHHVLPNCASITIVSGTTIAGLLIAGEATLTFLGIGVQQPSISWGLMIDDAQRRIGATPHLLIFPTLGLTAVVAAFVLLGDALRDALDPRSA